MATSELNHDQQMALLGANNALEEAERCLISLITDGYDVMRTLGHVQMAMSMLDQGEGGGETDGDDGA